MGLNAKQNNLLPNENYGLTESLLTIIGIESGATPLCFNDVFQINSQLPVVRLYFAIMSELNRK